MTDLTDIDNYFYDKSDIDNTVNEQKEERIIVGIDLGTTNLCVAIWRNKNLEIIPDEYGNRTVPSVVAFTNRTKYIGKEAKNQIDINPENTFYEVKRLIGRKYSDESVQNDKSFLSYIIDKDNEDNIQLLTKLSGNIHKTSYTPEEISAYTLLEAKRMAEKYLNKTVKDVVITVPAYFNDAQRQATKDSARIAGLNCLRIIHEPTAAALAYGLEKKVAFGKNDINVLVYDLGGGTLDASILNISDGVFQVLASCGNCHLGGADFDNRLVTYCINQFKKRNNYDKLSDLSLLSLQKLKLSCENAKKILSISSRANIIVKDFYDNKNLNISITREKFESLCKDLFILCLKFVEDALYSCSLNRDNIDEIILTGGATRMPTIRENLKLFFGGKEPNCSMNPDEVVAAGAAIEGYVLANGSDPFSENITLLDITALSLGVETVGAVMTTIIPRNSAIPIKRKKKFTTDTDYETSVEIKIYEGERSMTKDNFFVGKFELTGLEKAPRGFAEIEVTFSIDINGIISVTAEDLKNPENKNTVTVNSNKGRLTEQKIQELILEAKHFEAKDKIERLKRQLFYQIEDLCSNVLLNLQNPDCKLKDSDKELIITDINNNLNWLKEKNYLDRDKKEFTDVLEQIKKKYGTLILKINVDSGTIKGRSDNGTLTSIYDDIDKDNEFEEINHTDDIDDENTRELKQLRETTIELCYNVLEVINYDSLKQEVKQEMKDYIDDILLWIHVKEKISKTEYEQKIEEINNYCNDITTKYAPDELFGIDITTINTKRDELNNLCLTLSNSLEHNLILLQKNSMDLLKNKITDTIEWLNNNIIDDDKLYQNKINEINEICDTIYKTILGFETEVQPNVLNNLTEETNTYGTSISKLKNNSK